MTSSLCPTHSIRQTVSLPEPWEDYTPVTLSPSTPIPMSSLSQWIWVHKAMKDQLVAGVLFWKSLALRKLEMPRTERPLPLHSQVPSPQGDTCVSWVMGPRGRKGAAAVRVVAAEYRFWPQTVLSYSQLCACLPAWLGTISSFRISLLSFIRFSHSIFIDHLFYSRPSSRHRDHLGEVLASLSLPSNWGDK